MPNRCVEETQRTAILALRGQGFGARRIQSELRLYEKMNFSLSMIHKVLKAAHVAPLAIAQRLEEWQFT